MLTPPSDAECESLAQSLVIFGRAHGQIAYAVELHDAYRGQVVAAYHGGRFGHPYAQIAEDKIVLELAHCLDEYGTYYEPLVGDDQPVEARAFFAVLGAEAASLRRLRSLVTGLPSGDPFDRTREVRAVMHTLPAALGYWRERGRESLVVLDAIWRHYAARAWFDVVRAKTAELSAHAQLGGEVSDN